MMWLLLLAAAGPPLLCLRGRTLGTAAGANVILLILASLVVLRLPGADLRLIWTAAAVLSLTIFSVLLARGEEVRWSANRAAAVAALVYAAAIPAMLQTPIDGDEPYYLLVTESMARDFDLDLRNQYAALAQSETGRLDLGPLPGDPVGRDGQQYSRHEPFLALLMLPGYVLAGLHGAVAIIAIFGVLLVRSTIRLMEDEGIGDAAVRGVFPFVALGPPILVYAVRIWPEVPAAFFFVEAIRGLREERAKRWVPALAGLVLLKLRFLLVAAGLLVSLAPALRKRGGWSAQTIRRWGLILLVAAVPLVVMWLVSGSATNVHTLDELAPGRWRDYLRGAGGLLADGMSGIAFQAPFYLLGLAAIFRWRTAPAGFRLGVAASVLYVVTLLPRMEWFGGWAPPLRYVAFLMPVLALGAAHLWKSIPRSVIAILAAWTAGLTVHALARPWRLFHLFNGENPAGEWLSSLHGSDFSRLFPSFIRLNDAAWPGAAAVVAVVTLLAWSSVRREGDARQVPALHAVVALLLAFALAAGQRPADRIHFEDAHLSRSGGSLYPELYTMTRHWYRGGWVIGAGDSVSFLANEGEWTLHAITGLGALIELDGHAYRISRNDAYQEIAVTVKESGRVTMRCLEGAVNLDRMDRHD